MKRSRISSASPGSPNTSSPESSAGSSCACSARSAVSSRISSASATRSVERCPQITSRSSARRWSADLAARAPCARVLDGGPRDHGALERDRLERALASSSSRRSGVAHSAARRPGKQPAGGALRLEQRAQRQQVVAERLERAVALAAELEASQRPGELVAVRRAARDEVAERAQLVLLLGGHDEHPVRPAAARRARAALQAPSPTRAQASAPSVTRPSPNRRSARSRSSSTSRPRASASRGSSSSTDEHDHEVGVVRGRRKRRRGQPVECLGRAIVSPRVSATSAEVDREPVQRGRRASPRRCEAAPDMLQPLERRGAALGLQLEVALLGEHVAQQARAEQRVRRSAPPACRRSAPRVAR